MMIEDTSTEKRRRLQSTAGFQNIDIIRTVSRFLTGV